MVSTSILRAPTSVISGPTTDLVAWSGPYSSNCFTLSFTFVASVACALAVFWADPSTAITLCSRPEMRASMSWMRCLTNV